MVGPVGGAVVLEVLAEQAVVVSVVVLVPVVVAVVSVSAASQAVATAALARMNKVAAAKGWQVVRCHVGGLCERRVLVVLGEVMGGQDTTRQGTDRRSG